MKLKVHPNSKFTMNLALNLGNLEDDSDVCVCFLKLKLPKSQSIYMNLFRLNHIFIALVTQKMLQLVIAELINLNTLFFHIL